MEITRTQLIEHLSQMTVMEVADLVRDLEETWQVSATPVAPIPGPVVPDDQGPEQTEFDVVLESFGEKKINVIKVLRKEVSGLGLKEAKEMVESAPTTIKEGIPRAEADELIQKLEEAGAKAIVK